MAHEDEDERGEEAAAEPDRFTDDSLAGYLVDEIARAFAAHDRAAAGTVQRILPLGEMLALFNLADQFGVIDRVRAALDRQRGRNAYLAFSEAMKGALLDQGFGQPAPSGRPPGTAPRPHRPPERGHPGRAGQGQQRRGEGRPPRDGRPPGPRRGE